MSTEKQQTSNSFADFNHDGKVTLDEQYIAYNIYKEVMDDAEETPTAPKGKVFASATVFPEERTEFPEPATLSECETRIKASKQNIATRFIVAAIGTIGAGFLLWCGFSAFDSTILAMILILAGLIALGCCWYCFDKETKTDRNELKMLKSRYQKSLKPGITQQQ